MHIISIHEKDTSTLSLFDELLLWGTLWDIRNLIFEDLIDSVSDLRILF